DERLGEREGEGTDGEGVNASGTAGARGLGLPVAADGVRWLGEAAGPLIGVGDSEDAHLAGAGALEVTAGRKDMDEAEQLKGEDHRGEGAEDAGGRAGSEFGCRCG